MFLSKHKNGFYYIYYFEPFTGKRKSISTKLKKKNEALTFLTSFSRHLEQTKQNRVIVISLKDFFWKFLMYSEAVHSPNSTKTFKTTFNSVLKYFGNITLTSLTKPKINEYLENKTRMVSRYQARKDLINLSSAFNKALAENYVIANPCAEIKRIKIPEKQPLFFSASELETLLFTIDDKDIRDLVIFAVNTGLRRTELLTLSWEQVNFKDKLVILDNRNNLTKSKKIRTIPLNLSAMQVVVERERAKTCNYIFTHLGKKIAPDKITRLFKEYVKSAEVNPQLNFHSLRHTFASWLVQKGVSIYQVSKLLGHADIKTTEVYSHLRAEDLRESVEMLN